MTIDTGPGRSQNEFKKNFSVYIFSGASMNLKTISTAHLGKLLGVILIVRTHKGVSEDG